MIFARGRIGLICPLAVFLATMLSTALVGQVNIDSLINARRERERALRPLYSMLYDVGSHVDTAILLEFEDLDSIKVGGTDSLRCAPLTLLPSLSCLVVEDAHLIDPAMLGKLTGLQRLILINVDLQNIAFVESLLDLREFELASTSGCLLSKYKCHLGDISPLGACSRLRKVSIRVDEVADISALANLRDLEDLRIAGTNVRSLAPLCGLHRLQRLYAHFNKVTSIDSALSGKPLLETLFLNYNDIISISPLVGLDSLRDLCLDDNDLTDLHCLSPLPHLKTLSLAGNKIIDVVALNAMTGLQTLNLRNNEISSLRPLAGLRELKRLNVGGNRLNSLEPLTGLTRLEQLSAPGNEIRSVGPLRNLVSLKRLDLRGNEIADLVPLAALQDLRRLDVGMNELESVDVLSRIPTLTYLSLGHNHIRSLEPLETLPLLVYVDVSANQIVDLEPLLKNELFGRYSTVDLTGNPLSRRAERKQIPLLEKRGVRVFRFQY